MKPLIAFFLAAVLTACSPSKTSQKTRPAQAQQATVKVIPAEGSGSGFVIKRRNVLGAQRLFLWTAAHIVEEKDLVVKIRQVIRVNDTKVGFQEFSARLLFRDAKSDIALLLLDAPSDIFPSLDFDEPYATRVGDATYHVGNFFGDFDASYSTGVLSQHGASHKAWLWGVDLDQTTALIVPGSSGGPIFNTSSGKVIGVAVGWPQVAGVSWFVPVRQMLAVAPRWSIYGCQCPEDSALIDLHKSNYPKPVTPAPEPIKVFIVNPSAPPPSAPEPKPEGDKPKRGLKRFSFRGW